MDTWSKPAGQFDPNVPATIHLAGDALDDERRISAVKDYQKWKANIRVDNTAVKFHRCLPATEMTEKGPHSSNQLAKLEGILKDPAKKSGIRYPGIRLNPSLSVVNNQDSYSPRKLSDASELKKGFGPGPFLEHSWSLERNNIPLRNYKHETFMKEKGQNFKYVHIIINLYLNLL